MRPFSRPLSAWFATAVVAAISLFSLNTAAVGQTYTLTVQSTPPTGIAISSSTGCGGATNYSVPSIASGTGVDLTAPATDPTGFTFSMWTVNGTAQTAGLKSITFTMTADTTAVAQYAWNTYTLTVQSTPPTGVVISSSTSDGGTTNYTAPAVGYGSSVNLIAPATDPTGYTFSQWTVNGTAQTAALKNITFTLSAATTAVAQYTLSSYLLTVQSTSPTGLGITSSGAYGGTTNYTVPGVVYGTSVNLVAPGTDPAGYTFSKWTVNGVSQTAGLKNITLTLSAATTAVAQYTLNTYLLAVLSTPPTGLSITSSGAQGGMTNYTVPSIGSGTSVNLQAPASDPAGYTFSQWTVNGTAQTAGLKNITFTMSAVTTAVAQYTTNTYTLTVQSTPPTGLSIASNGAYGGTTNYTAPGVAYGTSVNLVAPATDPTGLYTFSQWTVNGWLQAPGQNSLTFAMSGLTTAVAQYVTYTLSVQSTPPTGLGIGSTTGDGGTTNYSVMGITSGATVNLSVPATDPTGYAFRQWVVNGAAQTAGQKSVTFPAPASCLAWGSQGSGNGQFNYPQGVAVDAAGNVYVADTTNSRIQEFTSTGVYLTQWGGAGSGNGQFIHPQGVAVDGAGNVYVADTCNSRIQEFTSTGVYLTQWGGAGSGNGQFNHPQGIAVDGAGNVYVADSGNSRIQKFTSAGAYVTQWSGVAAANGNTVTVPCNPLWTDTGINLRPQEFATIGVLTGTWNFFNHWNGGEGSSVVQASDCWITNGVQGELIGFIGLSGLNLNSFPRVIQQNDAGLFAIGTGPVTMSGMSGELWLGCSDDYVSNDIGDNAGSLSVQVQVFTGPTGIAVDGAGNVYVPDAENNCIRKFTSAGVYVSQWGGYGSGLGQFDFPSGIALDSAGNVYVADSGNNRIQEFTSAGVYVTEWGGYGMGNGQCDDPCGIAVDSAGNVHVADTGNDRVQVFSQNILAVAQYAANVSTLTVQSTPVTGLGITSSTGDGGTTNYTVSNVAGGTSVNLQAPAADPTGYVFAQWTLNGVTQGVGQKAITFLTMADTTAVAQYTPTYTLGVQDNIASHGLAITSSTGQGGTTNYTTSVICGAIVTLTAPAVTGYSFSSWSGVSGSQSGNSITFTMPGSDATETANYTVNSCTLSVQSTPLTGRAIAGTYPGTTNYTASVNYAASVTLTAPTVTGYTFTGWTGYAATSGNTVSFMMPASAVTETANYVIQSYTLNVQDNTLSQGLPITSSTGTGGTTNYTESVNYGATVTLTAPSTDPASYTFSSWSVTGATNTGSVKACSFTMPANDVTALAQYTSYDLTVQSAPQTGVSIASTTGDAGTTDYSVIAITPGQNVNLSVPATDPAGSIFGQWAVNGAAQTAGQKSVTFSAPARYLIWGTSGSGNGQFNDPYGIALDSVGNVYVEEYSNARVQKFTSTGVYVTQWGGYGSGNGQLNAPWGIAVDAAGNVYVSDYGNRRIQKFTSTGVYVTQWGGLGGPEGVAVDSAGNVYVIDTSNRRVVKYTSAGVYVTQWGGSGSGNGQFNAPQGIGVDVAGNVYVTDTYNHRIQKFTPDGVYVTQWGSHGSADGQFYYPININGDVAGNVYVADCWNSRIQKFTSTGVYISQWGGSGSGTGQLDAPRGVALNASGNAVYVADTGNNRIQAFSQNILAVAQYTVNTYTLTVQSTPPTGVLISSSTSDGGWTNYTAPGVAYGSSVNLVAPATDPAGCTFSQWTVNGTAQTALQKSLTFTMTADTTAVAGYALNTYTLTVQSTPPTGVVIGSSGAYGGTTNYSAPGVAYGSSVNLAAPASDPANYTFWQWTVNGTGQGAGVKSITFAMSAGTTAVAIYTLNTYPLTVQSTPPAGVVITSSTSHGGTTNYTIPGVGYGRSVNLVAPASDPANYTFAQWTVNGTGQSAGVKAITFTMPAVATTAVATYTLNTYLLTVQSTPPTGVVITSSTSDGGTTNYTAPGVSYGTSVNLVAPASDPANYTFSNWTVNGTAQTAGLKSITFTMSADTTAVAIYTLNTYLLTVNSTPPTGVVITSSTSDGGTTNYTVPGVAYGASVNLVAPATNPTGYTFSQWTVNGTAQTAGLKNITFTMSAATTAVAQYTPAFTLTVQSTPPTGLGIGSVAGCGGTTNYTVTGIASGTIVDLTAPATDPSGLYTFQEWTLNGVAQTVGLIAVTFTMTAGTTAVAEYTTYTLNVQSTPPTGVSIASTTGDAGTTNYSVIGLTAGQNVNLVAPATDPSGYTFNQWTVNGVAQTAGQKSVTFPAPASFLTWGDYGTSNGYFQFPLGVAVSSTGNVYVADNHRIQKFTSAGTYVTQWGSSGNGDGQFNWPWGVAVDSAGNVYVADSGNSRVEKFTSNGIYITQWGGSGSGNGRFNYPTGIAVDSAGNVYVADTNNCLIQKFTSGGVFITQWGGEGNGQFQLPFGIAVDSASNVYLADYIKNCILKYTSTGAYVTQWGSAGSGDGLLNEPEGVVVDSSGNVYVADMANNRIQEFTSSGTYLTQWGNAGHGNGQFNHPYGIALDIAGNIYVADTNNSRVQVFRQGFLAVAQYTTNTYALTVQSTPPTGVAIGSTTSDAGTTNYTVPSVTYGTSVNLVAPTTDPTGCTFSQWAVNGTAQTAGQKSITFTMTAATTAVAQYTLKTYTLTVASTPPPGLSITSSGAYGGTTTYTAPGVGYGASVNLVAPATDPAGFTFWRWTVNGTAQTAGLKTITFPMPASAATAVANYTLSTYALTVQSTPPTGLSITSSGAYGGTTNYTVSGVAYGASVNLVAPATDPTGYTFSQWTVNGTAQTAGQKSIAFTMTAATAAVAEYTLNTYTLTVQSTAPTGVVIGSSSTDGGTTDYTVSSVAYGTNVNLAAPDADPTGYTFTQWTLNGTAQTALQKSITFTMTADTTAVAKYTLNTYALTVNDSTASNGLAIGSTTGHGGTTNYSAPGVGYGTSVDLQAPATDPAGYAWSGWTVNGAAFGAGAKEITSTITADTTAVANYTVNNYGLTVQSTPPTGLSISSSGAYGGTTNYTVPSVAYGTSVNLTAPATDPAGYTFSQWTVNGTAYTARSITFTMPAVATTTVAQYTPVYLLTVQSTPTTGIAIASGSGDGGTTNYTMSSVAYGTSMNLVAPATDPAGCTFSQWTVNGTAQTAGLKSITFTMTADTTAVAQYTLNTYLLTVQSTPLPGVVVSSGTSDGGTTNYTAPGVGYGASVNLVAPGTDPSGYTFSRWTVNGTALTAGLKNITFTMTANTTAVAGYSANRVVYVVPSSGTPGGKVIVPINLNSQGDENSLTFSLDWDTTVLTYVSSALGTDDAGSSLTRNETQTGQGEVGILIGQSPGQVFSAGTKQVLLVTFNIKSGWVGTTSITFGNTPAPESISDVNGVLLSAGWQGGQVESRIAVCVVASSGVPGGTVIVPINLNGPGNENSLSFSLNWDTTVLTYVSSALGADDGGCSFIRNEALTGQGQLGVLIGQTVGQVFSSGAKQILLVTFSIKSGWMGTTPITFGDAPATENVSDVNGNPLTVGWQDGQVICGLEGDVNMDGTVNAADWTIIGRMAVGLAPAPTGLAFQAADCGPRSTLGKGVISAQAWTQVGRYVVGLDPLTAIGGPFAPAGVLDLESTPPAIAITSSTGHCGTTNCTMSGIASGTSVNLQAPATDPAGYTFSQWVVNGVLQAAGQKSITFTMTAGTLAVAQYTTTAAH